MANRIKGITVEIGGDTTKLSKALEGVNKDIKGTQTQLKDVQKLLKLDPTNTELLSQKHKLLADAVSATEQKSKVKTKSAYLANIIAGTPVFLCLENGCISKKFGCIFAHKKTFTQTENRFRGKSEPVFLLLNTSQRTITF